MRDILSTQLLRSLDGASNLETGARVSGGCSYQPLESQRVSLLLIAVGVALFLLAGLHNGPQDWESDNG